MEDRHDINQDMQRPPREYVGFGDRMRCVLHDLVVLVAIFMLINVPFGMSLYFEWISDIFFKIGLNSSWVCIELIFLGYLIYLWRLPTHCQKKLGFLTESRDGVPIRVAGIRRIFFTALFLESGMCLVLGSGYFWRDYWSALSIFLLFPILVQITSFWDPQKRSLIDMASGHVMVKAGQEDVSSNVSGSFRQQADGSPVKYAGFLIRLASMVIDALCYTLAFLVVGIVFGFVYILLFEKGFQSGLGNLAGMLVMTAVGFIPIIGYIIGDFIYLLVLPTFGQQMLHLRMERRDGKTVHFAGIRRMFVMVLFLVVGAGVYVFMVDDVPPHVLILILLLLSQVSVIWDPQKRSLSDMASGHVMVRVADGEMRKQGKVRGSLVEHASLLVRMGRMVGYIAISMAVSIMLTIVLFAF